MDELGNPSRIRRIIKTNQMKTTTQMLRQYPVTDGTTKIHESSINLLQEIERNQLLLAYDYAKLTIFKAQVLVYLINTELACVVVLAL